METYEHGVFFERKNLSDAELKHIHMYFQIKRRSGGGDCEILKVDANNYKICFREKEAQERVLRREDHVINVPGQDSICVSLSCDNVAESNKQPQASAQQTSASAKQTKKVFKLEPYLLRYLSECTLANSNLEKRLSLLSSTFQIDIDSEELVVVTDSAQDGYSLKKLSFAIGEAVAGIEKSYILHFEVERDRLAVLQENSFLSNEHIKIFHEGTLAVVVGEREQVDKIAKYIDTLQAKQMDQKVCRISEKKFALVKEQFEQSRKSNFPNVKINQDRPGILILKGSEKEVHAGEKELLNLVSEIKDKSIPLHHTLLTFLESSGVVQHFQNRFQHSLRSPVMLENAGSDLLLLSLSNEALLEAAAAVQRDLRFETMSLENTEGQSPRFIKLKETLSKAIRQANQQGVKVNVDYQHRTDSAGPRINIDIVGDTTEVCRLKDIVLEYKRNHENTVQTIPLPMQEMAEDFSEILSLVDVENSTVEINPTCLPSPCVHLIGPRCEVDSLKKKLETALKRLVIKRYKVEGPGAQQFFKDDDKKTLQLVKNSFRVQIVLIDEMQRSNNVPNDTSCASLQNLPNTPQSMQTDDKDINIKVVVGCLEEQQADVFVAPMIKANLTSTAIASCLLRKGGQQFQSNFNNAKGQRSLTPGDVLDVKGTPTLGCSKVFLIECLPKGEQKDKSDEALRSGLDKVFALCEQQSLGSVALPIIGPGLALSIPVKDAVNILNSQMIRFLSGSTASLHTISIIIMPDNVHSEEMFQTICGDLSAKMVDDTGQALFSLTSDLDEIVVAIAGIQLHIVFGDISNETTDVVVNTTDFTDLQTGVCQDILTKAGSEILAQVKRAQVQRGQIFKTQPGGFPCKQIMNVCGERDANVIKTLAKEIVIQCEHGHYQSVAIPAICTGKGAMDPKEVAKCILQGVKDGVQGANLQYLKNIRIILLKINIFLAFKATAQNNFGTHTQFSVPGPLVPTLTTTRGRNPTNRTRRSQSLPIQNNRNLLYSLPVIKDKAEFLVIGHSTVDVSNACRELQHAYENQCSSQSFCSEDIDCLSDGEKEQLCSKVKSLHLQIQNTSSKEWVVLGQKDGVNEVVSLVQSGLRKQVIKRDQESLFTKVTWCILGPRGFWEKVSKEMNHRLEKRDVKDGIVDAHSLKWTVDLRKMVATACGTGKKTSLKRLENRSDFSLPIYWDDINPNEPQKIIDLEQSSPEFQKIKADFKKTVSKTVLKIERIQNVNLRRLYEGRKKELENRNAPNGASEKILYHGTTKEACSSIINTNFNRSCAGQNATRYGVGTYFAVNASYSANPLYSVPASDGTQLMFVARVLTGNYTQGQEAMRILPDNFDSVVDNTQDPSMFVVFHDCQAYPDYLIKFK